MPEWVNFIISLAGGLGGLFTIGSFAVQLIERRERKMIEGSTRKTLPKSRTTIHESDFQISRTRVAVLTVFLLTSIGFSTAGLVSSIRREEPLKPSLRPENIAGTVHGWLDSFNVSVQKQTPVDDPVMNFELVATGGITSTHIVIFTRRGLERYLILQTAVTVGDEHKVMLAKMADGEVGQVEHEIALELGKSRVSYVMDNNPPLTSITILKRLPISNSLDEGMFIDALDEVTSANVLAREVVATIIERHAKPPSQK